MLPQQIVPVELAPTGDVVALTAGNGLALTIGAFQDEALRRSVMVAWEP